MATRQAAETPAPDRPMRADARRNYSKLLAEAAKVFAELGADAPLDEIAKRARVGNATLYRHFPTRKVLLEAVYRDDVSRLCELAYALARQNGAAGGGVDAVAGGAKDAVAVGAEHMVAGGGEDAVAVGRERAVAGAAEDAIAGLIDWLRAAIECCSTVTGLKGLLAMALRDKGAALDSWCRASITAAADAVLAPAQATGAVRLDVDPLTLMRLVSAISIAADAGGAEAAEHLLSLVVEGLRVR